MPTLYFDLETRSACSLRDAGAWAYAADPTTEILCLCYAIDDGTVSAWKSGEPIPQVFHAVASDPANWKVVAHNIEFERAIHEHILVPRHGFPPLPLAVQHCTMTLALANAYPPELARLATALALDYQKDAEGTRLMRQMSRLRKNRKDEKGINWVFDDKKLARLITYCANDVEVTRKVWTHSHLKPLIPFERKVQLLDAVINRRGVHFDRRFAECARELSARERTALGNKLEYLTNGVVTSVDQVGRLRAYVNGLGHNLASVDRRAIAAALAANTDEATRLVLEARRAGARSSVRKFKRLLAWAGQDDRLRGTARFHGGAPGRWSGQGPQLQNLLRNDLGIPPATVAAVLAQDRAALASYGSPLEVIGSISRAVLTAAPGHRFFICDLSAIESRVLAWLANEAWKIEAYAEFDRTGNVQIEPYRAVARRMLRKDPAAEITAVERQIGKGGDLAGGFGGSVGAWRRLLPGDEREDDEILADIHAWRDAHPRTTAFWRALARAARIAIRIPGCSSPAGRITAHSEQGALYLTLPSGRRIVYPEARLTPSKFEDAPPDILFKDNARGQWADRRAWFGTLVENVVQGIARDLLAEAIVRLEAAGVPVVLTVHDEIVAELPIDATLTPEVFKALVLTAPGWADGLPLAGKIRVADNYLPPLEESATPVPVDIDEDLANWLPDKDLPTVSKKAIERADGEHYVNTLSDATAPLWELTTLPLSGDRKVSCPFHEDPVPSCQLYADHFYCFGCGRYGNRVDWLVQAEGMTETEALTVIADWQGSPAGAGETERDDKIGYALGWWEQALPIVGTLAERYLAETRGIDVQRLPANISDSLRFHRACIFGSQRLACLLALMRDPITDAPTGIQRIGLEVHGNRVMKVQRMALGVTGAVKIWPANGRLVVGEGLETVLAAATRLAWNGEQLVPAWALVSSGKLATLPPLPGVRQLVVLVDHDHNGEGQRAAEGLTQSWQGAGREVLQLLPDRSGADFNDVVLQGRP